MPTVTYVAKSVPFYRNGFLQDVHAQLAEDHIKFRVLVAAQALDGSDLAGRDWVTPVRSRAVRLGSREARWNGVVTLTRRDSLVVLEHASHLLENYPILVRSRLGGPRVALWGHGRHYQPHRALVLSEGFKGWWSRQPAWWFAYTQDGADAVVAGGFPANRVSVLNNSTDTDEIQRVEASVSRSDIARTLAEIGVPAGRVCIFSGSLYAEKNLEVLVAAADEIRQRVPEFVLVVAGSGPQEEWMREVSSTRPYLIHAGPVTDVRRIHLLLAAELMLMPGLVGLAAVDSIWTSTPLVTFSVDYHSPEIAYIRDGRNGVVIDRPPNVSDFADAVVSLLSDERRLESLRKGCASSRDVVSKGGMVESFVKGVHSALRVGD